MYLVDANVPIEAKNRYYAFDIAPGFWAWLDQAHNDAVACSLEAVRNELLEGSDELADWAKKNAAFFRSIDQGATKHFGTLTAWAGSRDFTAAALSNFTGNNADYLLIAYAREHQHTVVTHERSQPNTRNRVLIPDACLAMGVSTVDTFEMLRHTGAHLIFARALRRHSAVKVISRVRLQIGQAFSVPLHLASGSRFLFHRSSIFLASTE